MIPALEAADNATPRFAPTALHSMQVHSWGVVPRELRLSDARTSAGPLEGTPNADGQGCFHLAS